MKSEGLLTPLEAAHHLGITSELLFQFTKRSFGQAGRLKPLPSVEQDDQTRFSPSDLDAFDSMLRGEWCDRSEGRPSIPKAILDHLRAESRNQCARCGRGVGVETAHIRPWATSRSHHPHNLIRICSGCHREHDAQHSLTTEGLQAIKARLIARTRANLMERAQPARKYLRSPRASRDFVGREKELEVLVDALRSGRSAGVYGVAGIGKSELLLQAISRCNTGRPVLWCNIEQYRNVADVVSALRVALAIDGTGYDDGDLPSQLDAAHTCVVFDGIEQASLDDLDEFEDAVHALFHATSDTQFVSTSQIVLHRLPAEIQLRLGGLGGVASQSLLRQSCPVGRDAIHGDTDELLSFCDGHALTLKLAGALMRHYGSANAALNAIHRFGTQCVSLPGRKHQTRQTSLELCLQTAYKALAESGRQLLWALAQAPAGVLTHYIERQWLELEESAEALASLRTWHLVELDIVDKQLGRARILAPVRRFVVERGSEEDPGSFEHMVGRVIQDFGMMVAVLELKYDAFEDTPYVLRRFGDELPNLVHALELAQERPDDVHLVTTALSIVESLMRYFFVLGLAERGAQVMFRATELALQTRQFEKASGLAMQFLALTQRAQDETLFASGLGIVKRIANASSDNPEMLADVAMCRAMAAQRASDYPRAERCARQAFEGYRALLSSFRDETSVNATIERDSLQNDLSNALGALGFSLLSQRKYEEAAGAYRHSLRHERGAAVAVNRGQVLHQIGNCESHLGNHEVAAKLYVEAAKIFHFVGMEEYLSNAFGELGYTLLDVDLTEVRDCLDDDIIDHSLVDLGNHAARIFNLARPLDRIRCVGMARKLFGMVILLSLTGHDEELGAFCVKMENETVKKVVHQVDAGIGDAEADDREELILMADVSLRLGVLVAKCEGDLRENGEAVHDTLEGILRITFGANEQTQVTMRLLDWVAVYLTRRLGFTGIDPARIHEVARDCGGEAGDYLDRIRSS